MTAEQPRLTAAEAGALARDHFGLTGTLAGADVDVETLTYGISSGVASGVNEVSLAGTYGTLTVMYGITTSGLDSRGRRT